MVKHKNLEIEKSKLRKEVYEDGITTLGKKGNSSAVWILNYLKNHEDKELEKLKKDNNG